MNIISYRYTNSFRQFLLLTGMLYFLLSLAGTLMVPIFNIEGYEAKAIIALCIYYIFAIAILIVIFRSHKFCYTLYDDETITYYNRLTRKDRSIEISEIKKAVLGKKGVNLYGEDSSNPIFFIPFFRGGRVDALEIDKFYKMLKEKEDVSVCKEFTILPGYGKPWIILKILYVFLTALTLLSCATPLAVVIILWQNFM